MFSDLTFEGYLAGSTPDPPFEGVFCIFLFSGTGCSSVRVVHLTGEHFGIITYTTHNLPHGQVVTHCAFYIVLGITLNAPPKCHLGLIFVLFIKNKRLSSNSIQFE